MEAGGQLIGPTCECGRAVATGCSGGSCPRCLETERDQLRRELEALQRPACYECESRDGLAGDCECCGQSFCHVCLEGHTATGTPISCVLREREEAVEALRKLLNTNPGTEEENDAVREGFELIERLDAGEEAVHEHS